MTAAGEVWEKDGERREAAGAKRVEKETTDAE
jgi:hypothetical protein